LTKKFLFIYILKHGKQHFGFDYIKEADSTTALKNVVDCGKIFVSLCREY